MPCEPASGAVISGVPYFPSKRTNYCSEAAVQMLLAHYGRGMDQDAIHRIGWKLPQQLGILRGHFPQVTVGKANPTKIKEWVDRGIPVPLMLDYSGQEHKVLAVGYDNGDRTIIVHDPDAGPYVRVPLIDLMNAHGAVFVEPPAKGLAGMWTPFKILKAFVGGK